MNINIDYFFDCKSQPLQSVMVVGVASSCRDGQSLKFE